MIDKTTIAAARAVLMSRRNRKPIVEPVDWNQWPRWAVDLESQKVEGEKGVGDTAARIVGPIGGDAFKSWFKAVFRRSCGCTEAQARLNAQFPYLER